MSGFPSLQTLLLQILCLGLFSVLSTATCYYPNGNPATRDVQCTSGANSSCCGRGSICLDNGFCLSATQPFGLSRGSCTDPKFDIDECPKACTDIQTNGGCDIVLYNNTDDGIYYCCNSIVNNATGKQPTCAWDVEPFTLASARLIPGVALLDDYVVRSDDTNTTAPSTESDPECAASDTASKNNAAIGAGVGVPLGVVALAAIGWALYERRKRTNHSQTAIATQPRDVPSYGADMPMDQYKLYPKPLEPAELGSSLPARW
ncbi:hypothetical protein BJX99DRAFT_267632 [Aspergillus californicus]